MKYAWLACCLCFLCYDYLLDSCCAQTTGLSVNLSPRLLVVPVNTCVLLACEVRYAGSYSVQWYRDSDEHPFHSNPSVENSSTINHILSVTNEYNNTLIQCVVHTDLSENDVTAESNSITVIAIPEAPSVSLSPRLLVVPVNTSVLLSCEVHYAGSYFVQWKRDSDEHPFDSNPPVVNSSIITHTLSVTDEYKNAMIHCIVRAVNHTVESNSIKVNAVSEETVGADVAGSPQVEPLLDFESLPGFRLRWSPPFLWRAFPIDYCVVSIIRTNHSDSVYYGKNIKMIVELNTTFSESGIMSLNFNESTDDQQSQSCVEMMFVIIAFNSKDGFHSKSVSAIGRYPSDVGNFSESAVNTVTMVTSNAFSQKLLVRIQIKLPPLCSYQEMSYSILINNENESAIYNMTFYRTGSGTVCHDVSQDDADGLTINQNYTLKVIASASFADSEPTSACHEFDTVFNSAYKTQCNDFLLTLIFTVPCVLNNTYYK